VIRFSQLGDQQMESVLNESASDGEHLLGEINDRRKKPDRRLSSRKKNSEVRQDILAERRLF
jgi:hypothetical protein